MYFNSLGSAANYLAIQAVRSVSRHCDNLLEQMGQATVKRAQQKLGVYQPSVGPFAAWAPLSPFTLEKKARYGWGRGGNPDTPMYATGEFEQSIGYQVHSGTKSVQIGTALHHIVYTELGTNKMPPRPVFGPAALETVPQFLPNIGPMTAAAIGGYAAFNTFSWPQRSGNMGNTVIGP